MDLILWRHAEAEAERPGRSDLDRELTPEGERQARRMAAWLNPRLAHSTRILVSPARRTQRTAEALGRDVRTLAALAPGADPRTVLEAVGWPDAPEPVLVVGHQPTLGQVAALLLSGQPQYWSVKKGAVWWLRHRRREDAQVLLHAVQGPDGL